MVETPEERQKRLAQTRFGVEGSESRQTRLFPGERTLGGGLYVPPSEVKREAAERTPRRLTAPGPRLGEYGPAGTGQFQGR